MGGVLKFEQFADVTCEWSLIPLADDAGGERLEHGVALQRGPRDGRGQAGEKVNVVVFSGNELSFLSIKTYIQYYDI